VGHRSSTLLSARRFFARARACRAAKPFVATAVVVFSMFLLALSRIVRSIGTVDVCSIPQIAGWFSSARTSRRCRPPPRLDGASPHITVWLRLALRVVCRAVSARR
jgi:hypothetical protein